MIGMLREIAIVFVNRILLASILELFRQPGLLNAKLVCISWQFLSLLKTRLVFVGSHGASPFLISQLEGTRQSGGFVSKS
jgi:hypothetical protein